MALNPPVPGLKATDSGLRSIFYDAVSPAKLNLIIQPGDQLDVSDDVAAQLLGSSAQFKEGTAPAPAAPESEPVADDEPAEEPKPKKRAARRPRSTDD